GVEADTLADERDLGMGGIAPAHVDQTWRAIGGAADGMDERKILLEQIVADDRREARAVTIGKRAGSLLELRRPHVVCGRVDEIAREKDACDDAGEVFGVDPLGDFEPRRLVVRLAVAPEAIAAERKGERRQARIGRCYGETIGARRE